MRITQADGYDEPRDSISHDWMLTLKKWGATPFLIPNIGTDAVSYFQELNLDILLLTGGDDIGTTPIRDNTEASLLSYAEEADVPVFGVCRGMQFINKKFGGRDAPVKGHAATSHSVKFSKSWQPFYSATSNVNSFHNTGIPTDALSSELKIGALDQNEGVEGLYHSSKPIAAVMWHPERASAPLGDRQLILSLMDKNKR